MNDDILVKDRSEKILKLFPEKHRRPVIQIITKNASQRLTVVLTAADHTVLPPDQFRDDLAIRYWRTLRRLLIQCDRCDSVMNLTHATYCKMVA